MKILQAVSFLLLGFGFSLLCAGRTATATFQEHSWKNQRYYSLLDGNELYTFCQDAAKNVTVKGGEKVYSREAGGSAFGAGNCWGYVEAVADSIPADTGFVPDENVLLSQHVDVVLKYLRDNPAERQKPAYYLARTALENAYPVRKPK
jgi:Rap1a immunity proteins